MKSTRFEEWEKSLEGVIARSKRWRVRAYREVTSTMDAARDDLDELVSCDAALFLSERQTKGRGRQGRDWTSPSGGFYCTFVFKKQGDVSVLSGLSLAVGLSILKSLSLSEKQAGLKWPNDILTPDGKKIGGILIEVISKGEMNFVLVGVGINLSEDPIEGSESLKNLTQSELAPIGATALIGEELRETFERFSRVGFAPYKEEWLSRALFRGSIITIHSGTELISGEFVDIGPTGSIILSQNGMKRDVSSGHVVEISNASRF